MVIGKRFRKFAVASTATAALLAGSVGVSFAQIDEIVVTATKRAENVQDIPVSVATVSGEKLDVLASGGLDIRFLSARIPSLQIESSFGRAFPRFYIRGLGNTDFDLNSSQPVSLVYDDVILENPILKGFPLFDLERVEVLRGPQGTLFGRNTPAGIVKFDSVKPSQEFSGYGKVGYGRFNAINVEGAVGGPLNDVTSGRASVLFQRRDDWVDNVAVGFEEEDALEGFDEFAARLQLLFEPNDKFSGLFNVHARRLRGTARVFRANIADGSDDGIVDSYQVNQTNPGFTGGTLADFERDEVYQDSPNFQEVNEFGGIANLEYDFGSVTLTSISGYENVEIFTRGDIDGGIGDLFGDGFEATPPAVGGPGIIPFRADTQDNIPHLDQFTQELRLSSNEWGRVDAQVGFFYFYENVDIETFDFGDTAIQAGVEDPVAEAFQNQKTNSWAVFASVDIDLTEQLNLRGGVRYTDETKDFEASRPIDTRPAFLEFGGPITPAPVETDDEVISWDASLSYEATEDVLLFTRVAKGFRAPSIQGRIGFFAADLNADGIPDSQDLVNASISVGDTETIMSYEAGFKADLFGNRARLNMTGFYYKINDQQLTAVGGAGNFNTLINADETKGYGFELEAEVAPLENLFLTMGTSYNFTEIDDPNLTTAPCGAPITPCTVLDPLDVNGNAILDGNRLPQAPRWIANWTARYGIPVRGGSSEFFMYTDWALRTKVSFFLYDSAEFNDGFLLEGGLRAGYAWNEGQYEVAAFGRNITNDLSLTGGIDFNNLVGFINEPPTWGIELKGQF